jgi:branched-chain amino acid transport system substrate-binding protein
MHKSKLGPGCMVLVLALALVITLIGCGGGGAGTTGTPAGTNIGSTTTQTATPTSTSGQTSDELINGVIAGIEKASTYRFEMNTALNAKGTSQGDYGELNFDSNSSGAVDKVDQEMQMEVNASGSFRGAPESEQWTGRMRTYAQDDTIYVGTQEDGSAEKWVISGATEAIWHSEDFLSKWAEIIRGADIKVLGTEKVEGISCYVAEIYPDLGKLLDLLGSQFGSSMPIRLKGEYMSNFLCKGWYAQDTFLPMKGYQEYDLNIREGSDNLTGHVTASLLFHDYNEPISIILPPEVPYRVGAIFSTSGFNSTLGQTQRPTVDMLVDQINKAGGINGHPLEVIIYDTKSDTATAATLARKLIYDRALAIIGPTSTGESMAVKPIANQAGVPLISCDAGSVIVEPVGNYTWVFNTPQLDYVAIERLYIYLQEQNITKIALLTDTAGFGTAGRNWLKNQDLLNKYGLTIVADGDQTYGAYDVDMQAQLTKIKGTDAQAIVCWGTNRGPAIIARQMRTLGMTIPLLCSHGIAFKSFIETAGAAANGIVFCAGKLPIVDQLPDTDPQKALLEKYKTDFVARYGVADVFGGYAYDALMMVVDALKVVGPDKAKIRDYIENDIVNWPGIGGVYNMSPQDHNGLPRDPKQAMILVKIVDGQWTWLQD